MYKILLLSALLFFNNYCRAQEKDYRVVFDITSRDSVTHQTLLRQADIIKNSHPESKIVVVIYGQAINMVLKEQSSQIATIQKLLEMKDVSFKVCEITMKRNKLDKSQLIPGVEIIPDGIYEIISKQRKGWGYIKVAN